MSKQIATDRPTILSKTVPIVRSNLLQKTTANYP